METIYIVSLTIIHFMANIFVLYTALLWSAHGKVRFWELVGIILFGWIWFAIEAFRL